MKEKLITLSFFSMAFAFVEASVVLYLRNLLGVVNLPPGLAQALLLLPGIAFLQPQAAISIINKSNILMVEQFREAATLVILTCVGILCGKFFKERFVYFVIAFGIWDIFYYIFLKLISGWPTSFFDSDIFFLLPVPWVGPIFVPIIISLGLIIGALIYLKNIKD